MNREQMLALERGAKAWNFWRDQQGRHIDLKGTALRGRNLENFDFHGANFEDADLSECNLRGANLADTALFGTFFDRSVLAGAFLSHARIRGATFNDVDLTNSQLWLTHVASNDFGTRRVRTSFTNANLAGAFIADAMFIDADFTGASLENAKLLTSTFNRCTLTNADLRGAALLRTSFIATNLAAACNLDQVEHLGPVSIDLTTLEMAGGRIGGSFLRKCGINELAVQFAQLYQSDLSQESITSVVYDIHALRASRPVRTERLFISYSHADAEFVDVLEERFVAAGIRVWRDVHDMTVGRIEKQIETALQLCPLVVLVLSQSSVKSDWVEWEAARAREIEKELGRDVLCPVALDDSWKTSNWPRPLRRQIEHYYVLDFAGWRSHQLLQKQVDKLIQGVERFYSPAVPPPA